MGMFDGFVRAVSREYERRIRRASLVTEYGVAHHDHGHDDSAIENIAPGSTVPTIMAPPIATHDTYVSTPTASDAMLNELLTRPTVSPPSAPVMRAPQSTSATSDDDEEAEIVNL